MSSYNTGTLGELARRAAARFGAHEALVFEEGTPSDVMGGHTQIKDSHAKIAPEHTTINKVEVDSSARFDQLIEKYHTLESSLHESSALIAKQADAVARQGSSIEEVMVSLTQSRALMFVRVSALRGSVNLLRGCESKGF